MKRFLQFIIMAQVTACAFRSSTTVNNIEPQEEGSTIQSTDNPHFKLTLLIGKKANEYSVKAQLPMLELSTKGSFLKRVALKNGERKELDPIGPETFEVVDTGVIPGNSYRYDLWVIDAGLGLRAVGSATIQVPIDMEVSDRVDGETLLGAYRRMFIQESGWVVVSNRDLKLEVEELYSQNGGFVSQRANTGFDSPAAYSISIHAKKAQGLLRVMSNGDKGGPGGRGADAGPNNNFGPKGNDAVATKKPNCRDCDNFSICHHELGDGGRGPIGHTGGTGGQGGRGGDTGLVSIIADEAESFFVIPVANPGRGGDGGPGGNGGRGGPGGVPGKRDEHRICSRKEGRPGPLGPTGPQGPAGPTGHSGIVRPICIKIGSTESGDCSAFKN